MMFLSDKSNTASSFHITNEMPSPKRNERKQNLKSFMSKKDSAKRAEKATDTREINKHHFIMASSCILKYHYALCTQHIRVIHLHGKIIN